MSHCQTHEGSEGHGLRGPHWNPTVHVIGSEADPAVPVLRLVPLPGAHVIEIRQPQVVVGRHSSCEMQFLQPDVSRRHCRIFYADEQWQVEDLASLNGIWLNGKRVERASLQHSDVLRIAAHLFRVEIGTAGSIHAAAAKEDVERTQNILKSILASFAEEDDDEAEEPRRKSA